MATIIDEPVKCTFIHIPKTGGNSVTNWMMNNFDVRITKRRQHATITDAIEGNHSLGKLQREDLGWTFCVIRNPWDYLVSWYTFKVMLCKKYIQDLQDNPKLQESRKDKYNLAKQKKQLDFLHNGFEFWLRQTNRKPQHYWAKDCDYVMKLENIENEFKHVQKKLNCYISLKHLNKTEGREKDYRTYYEKQELIDIVAEKYRTDIINYNYNF